EAFAQSVLAVFVHEEADGAAVHAVDRLACVHELVQGLQHQAVAAEGDDDVGFLRGRIAVATNESVPRRFGLGRQARHEGDPVTGGHVGGRLGRGGRAAAAGSEAGMDRAVMLYTTFPSVVEAEKAGKALVEDRLAACVNILPGMVSHYRWQGAVERGEEV